MKERIKAKVASGADYTQAIASISPAGLKNGPQALNYEQFGEDVEEIAFEIVCSYSEIYNEMIHDLLDSSQ